MIRKSKEIIKLIKLVNTIFGNSGLEVCDNWASDSNAIGFYKNNQLIYIAFYNKDDYFYECDLITGDPDQPYLIQESNNTTKQQLIKIMSKFFAIEPK